MYEFFAWLNANHGAVEAVAAVGIAIFAGVTVALTTVIAKENRRLRRAGTEPAVAAYLRMNPSNPSAINFAVMNVGSGPAMNVSFTIDEDAADFEAHGVAYHHEPGTPPIAMLPPGESFETLFGVGPELLKSPPLKPFWVEINYLDLSGNQSAPTKQLLDVSPFGNVARLGSP